MTINSAGEPLTAVVVGAGVRGRIYADFALQHPDRLRIVAVAEPEEARRRAFAQHHGLSGDSCFTDWRQLISSARAADIAIITTQDTDHAEPAKALALLGYQLLLEKPVAMTLAEAEDLLAVVDAAGVVAAVCHVLRYTPYTQAFAETVRSGRIGDVVSVEHLEPVGHWHMAHSYVRGNWRRSDLSPGMLLAKSSHDLDWISLILDRPCVAVSSFGSLQVLRRENKPVAAGAATHCLQCDFEPECAFSARRIYIDRLVRGEVGWPVDVVVPHPTLEALTQALRTGPYGRCVYECDNDVVDHQVVSLAFEGGATASFTMVGLSEAGHRRSRVFGTKGELRGDGQMIEWHDFLTGTSTVIYDESSDATLAGGHGGGDDALMDAFVEALRTGDHSLILSDLATSVSTHRIVFAAEQSRLQGRVVTLT